jgi:hypothetical protein
MILAPAPMSTLSPTTGRRATVKPMSGSLVPRVTPLHDGAVFAYAFRADDRAHGMRQKQAAAYLHLRRHLYAEDDHVQHRKQFRDQAEAVRS